MALSMSPGVQEFYNHVHDTATGRFSGRAASGRAGFREGSHGPGKIGTTSVKSREATRHPEYGESRTKAGGKLQYRPNAKQMSRDARRSDAHMRGETDRSPAVSPRSGTFAKKGEALSRKWAAHRKEAGRQIDLRNERMQKANTLYYKQREIEGRNARLMSGKSAASMYKEHMAGVAKSRAGKPTTANEILARISRWNAKG